ASGDSELAAHIVTTSPDVTVSTNLGAWVNRRGIFDRAERADTFREEKVVSAQRWAMGPQGQHIELGIAEHNLFLQLAALGLAGPLFGQRLLPIGTIYDPFIKRGLDALNYALYQDARFILVATPSGITLAPEDGAPQSLVEPLIAYCGAVAPEALAAHEAILEDLPGAGLLAITSPGRLHRDWRTALAEGRPGIAERLLARLRPGAALVTVSDSHPATLSWLGGVTHDFVVPLGVDHFGQSGDIPDLYRVYGLDCEAIIDAAARACLRARPQAALP